MTDVQLILLILAIICVIFAYAGLTVEIIKLVQTKKRTKRRIKNDAQINSNGR